MDSLYKDKGRVATPNTSEGLHSLSVRARITCVLCPPPMRGTATLGRPEATSASGRASRSRGGRGGRGWVSHPCPTETGPAHHGGEVQGRPTTGSASMPAVTWPLAASPGSPTCPFRCCGEGRGCFPLPELWSVPTDPRQPQTPLHCFWSQVMVYSPCKVGNSSKKQQCKHLAAPTSSTSNVCPE